MRELHVPGLSLAIDRDGQVAKARGYGFANLELQAKATPDTVYEIGSTTKQFTAAAIMMLAQDGKLHLEDRIAKYFPESPEGWRNITIRHLLSHTSGIQNHVAVPHWMDVFKTDLAFETTPARDELLNMFFKLPLEFQPGETWAYDNTGYYLLGVIIERLAVNLTSNFWTNVFSRLLVCAPRAAPIHSHSFQTVRQDMNGKTINSRTDRFSFQQSRSPRGVFSPAWRIWRNGMQPFRVKNC